jgi:hypothetical protein
VVCVLILVGHIMGILVLLIPSSVDELLDSHGLLSLGAPSRMYACTARIQMEENLFDDMFCGRNAFML